MLKMFETEGQVSHIPMDPIFVPSVTYEGVEILQQLALHLIKSIPDLFSRDVQFFCYRMGREADSLLSRIVRCSN